MKRFVEVNPGTWVRPDWVTTIVARGGLPPFSEGGKPFRPSVHISIYGSEQIGWEFDDVTDARAFAAKIAAAVNDALAVKDPP